MTLEQALKLNAATANTQELREANKVLTKSLNSRLLTFKYHKNKNVDTTQASFFKDYTKKHGGAYQVKLEGPSVRKSHKGSMIKKGEKLGNTGVSRNALSSHVAEMQYWLNRKDSTVTGWYKMLNNPPRVIQNNPSLSKQYAKLSINDKSLFWKWFTSASKSIVNYDSETLINAINIIMKNPKNLTTLNETVELIKTQYDTLDKARQKPQKKFKTKRQYKR